MVETIWEGDIKEAFRAIELICIVDQIHEYATKQHRPFVMKHLEAWHDRHKRTMKTTAPGVDASNGTSTDLYPGNDEDDSSSADSLDFDDMASLFDLNIEMHPPEWSRLKGESTMIRNEKARQTRARNQGLRDLASRAQKLKKTPAQKRAKGRPPKVAAHKQKHPRKRQRAQLSKAANSKATKEAKQSFSRLTRSMTKSAQS